MSIKAMKLALEALENASPAAWASRVDSDTMKSIWRKHAEAMEGLQALLAELDNASCKSAQKRLEAQQPATTEPVAQWQKRHPVRTAGRWQSTDEHDAKWWHENAKGWEVRALYTRTAPSVPDDAMLDAERGRFLLEWLKRHGLLQAEFGQMGVGEKPENWWLLHAPWGIDETRPFFGHGKTPEQAIDAAMLAAKEGGE